MLYFVYISTMLGQITIGFVGVLAFLFTFWRRLREDYTSDTLFSVSFYILSGIALGFFASIKFLKPWWFWLETLGALLGFALGFFRFKLRFFEAFEAFAISFLPWLSLVFFADSVKNSSLTSLLAFAFLILLLGLFYYLDANYKSFTWYKSGRVGFAGLTAVGVFFLGRAIVALFFPFVLSFVVRYETITSGTVSFVLFLLVYNLARIRNI